MLNPRSLSVESTSRYLRLIGLVALGVALLLIINRPVMSTEAASPQVGIGSTHQNAFEFIGRIDQNDLDFSNFDLDRVLCPKIAEIEPVLPIYCIKVI